MLVLRFRVRHLVVVKNHADAYVPRLPFLKTTVISGSNAWGEFSAWAEGMDFVRDSIAYDDMVLCANDTLLRHGRLGFGDYLDLLAHKNADVQRAQLSGFVSAIPWSDCEIDGNKMTRNVCTKLFFVRANLLSRSLIEAAVEEASRYVEGLKPKRLSWQYFEFLDSWLHGNSGHRWYKARPVQDMPQSERKMKSAMIISEHLLTSAAGTDLLEVKRTSLRNRLGRIKRALR
jgi:hypothetical protein